jgi:hypothetical protein
MSVASRCIGDASQMDEPVILLPQTDPEITLLLNASQGFG